MSWDQLDLFAPPATLRRDEVACTRPIHTMHRTTDPATARLAAISALPSTKTNRWLALRALADAGTAGLDDFALERITGVPQTSIGKRRGELRDLGLVEMLVVDGKPVRRTSPSGSLASVWVITRAGVEAVWSGGAP